MHRLQLNNVNSGYNKKVVLTNVSFVAEKTGVYVVLGTNGSGKTTLFRTIAGVIEPFSGEILLDGENMITSREIRNKASYLSHNNAIPEEMTVRKALHFWSDMESNGNSVPVERRKLDTDRVIELLGLHELVEKKFSDLSEGQKKRIAIATIFLKERDLYLLDEPTSNLDPVFSKKVRDLILELAKNKIVLYSSHNLYEATDIGTHLLLIRRGKVEYFDNISDIRSNHYRIRIDVSADITEHVDCNMIVDSRMEQSRPGHYYFTLMLSNPDDAAAVLRKLIESGIKVYEMRALDNPLQELFEEKGV